MQIFSWTFVGVAGALLASVTPLTHAQAQAGAGNLACVGSGRAVHCAAVWGAGGGFPRIIDIPAFRSDEEQAASDWRFRRWSDRCRPAVQQDRYGVGRYHYAAPGCEFGKSED